jgi:hypothetical protein
MRPVSLRGRPPRDPRARLAGLMMLPRTIDKARALLRGGDPGDYLIAPGVSGWLLAEIGMTQADFVELVGQAADEHVVAAVVAQRVPPGRREQLNELVRTLTVGELPDDIRARYGRLYGSRDDELVVDVLVANDRSMVASSARRQARRVAIPGG